MKIVNECAKGRAKGSGRDCQPAGSRQPIHTPMIGRAQNTLSAVGAYLAAEVTLWI